MKLVITFFAVTIFGFFLWLTFNYFSVFGSITGYLPADEEEDYSVEESVNVGDTGTIFEEENLSENINSTIELEETIIEEKEEETAVITQPGAIIERGDFAFYENYQNHTIRLRVLNVGKASPGLTSQVKNDIPEASPLTIWRVVFEQSLYSGMNVYGTIVDFKKFTVGTLNGEPAYLLNSTGDYSDCPVSPLLQEDFEDFSPYSQCFIVASNAEPVLFFIGGRGSEYNLSPIVLK